VRERPPEVEVPAQLGHRERVHEARERAPGQKVDAPAAQLPGARTGQHEAEPPRLDEPVHLVQQIG
jgi:hypothetical protein